MKLSKDALEPVQFFGGLVAGYVSGFEARDAAMATLGPKGFFVAWALGAGIGTAFSVVAEALVGEKDKQDTRLGRYASAALKGAFSGAMGSMCGTYVSLHIAQGIPAPASRVPLDNAKDLVDSALSFHKDVLERGTGPVFARPVFPNVEGNLSFHPQVR